MRQLAALALVLLLPAAGRANDGAELDPASLFRRGRQEVSFAAGYGFGLAIGSDESDEVELLAAVPRWGIALTDPLGAEDRWYRGSLSLLAEGALLWAAEPDEGAGGGATLMLRYHFLSLGRLVPFVEVGAGIVGIDFDVEDQHDGFNFTPQGGIGAHCLLSQRTALTASWRLHHISNAGINEPNSGINDSLFLLGVTFFLE